MVAIAKNIRNGFGLIAVSSCRRVRTNAIMLHCCCRCSCLRACFLGLRPVFSSFVFRRPPTLCYACLDLRSNRKVVWKSCHDPWEQRGGRPGGSMTLKQLGSLPLALVPRPGPPGLPSGSSLGPHELPQHLKINSVEAPGPPDISWPPFWRLPGNPGTLPNILRYAQMKSA